MTNLLTRKLEAFGPLPDADKRLLDDVIQPAQLVGARMDLIREGDAPSDVNLILEGFACRYKTIPDGSRQIWPTWCRATSATCMCSS
jgi:CRP-like cAMP-binding protein